MLNLLHPQRLHRGRRDGRFVTLRPGAARGRRRRSDVTGYFPTHQNVHDRRVDADYNGWWCCLIPAEVIADVGYPLPLFVQWDDVEFGYRARSHGLATVTLPGAGIWHADFDVEGLGRRRGTSPCATP